MACCVWDAIWDVWPCGRVGGTTGIFRGCMKVGAVIMGWPCGRGCVSAAPYPASEPVVNLLPSMPLGFFGLPAACLYAIGTLAVDCISGEINEGSLLFLSFFSCRSSNCMIHGCKYVVPSIVRFLRLKQIRRCFSMLLVPGNSHLRPYQPSLRASLLFSGCYHVNHAVMHRRVRRHFSMQTSPSEEASLAGNVPALDGHLHELNKRYNIFTSMAAARPSGPPAGLSIAVKDNLCTHDLPTTAGSLLLKGTPSFLLVHPAILAFFPCASTRVFFMPSCLMPSRNQA